eukprot:3301789-Prymnesium_polylepis.1
MHPGRAVAHLQVVVDDARVEHRIRRHQLDRDPPLALDDRHVARVLRHVEHQPAVRDALRHRVRVVHPVGRAHLAV